MLASFTQQSLLSTPFPHARTVIAGLHAVSWTPFPENLSAELQRDHPTRLGRPVAGSLAYDFAIPSKKASHFYSITFNCSAFVPPRSMHSTIFGSGPFSDEDWTIATRTRTAYESAHTVAVAASA